MRENIDILGVFHDGSIVEIIGTLPNISFRIEIEYLRNMFPSKGDSFLAHLTGCESIEFYNWENETRSNVLAEIELEEPEILSIKQKGDSAHIICSTGEINVLYKKFKHFIQKRSTKNINAIPFQPHKLNAYCFLLQYLPH